MNKPVLRPAVTSDREKKDATRRELLAPAKPISTQVTRRTREGDDASKLKFRHIGIDKRSIDEKKRTIEVSFSSETREVRCYDWDLGEVPEILSHGEGACDLTPFLEAGSVLRNHRADEPIAIPLEARIDTETKRGKALIHFPEGDPDSERAWTKVRTGLIRGVSVGYDVRASEKVKPGQRSAAGHEGPCFVATRWSVHEISLTPVPADTSVGVGRTKSASLTAKENLNMNIRMLCRAAGLSDDFAKKLEERNLTVDEAMIEIEKEKKRLAERAKKTGKRAKARAEADAAAESEDADDEEDEEDEEEERATAVAKRERKAIESERKRCVEIRAAVKVAKLDDEFADNMIEEGVSLNDARAKIIEKMSEIDTRQNAAAGTGRGVAANGHVSVGEEGNEKKMRHLTVNLGRRAMAAHGGFSEDETTKKVEGAHVTLVGLFREYAEMIGMPGARHLDPTQLVTAVLNPNTKIRAAAANASGDLANALSNLQHKALMKAFGAAVPTWRSWCKKGNLSDFKIAPRIQLTDWAQLRETGENGEILDSKISDRVENNQLAVYARKISLTLQMIINDDLDALGRLPAMMGRSAMQLPSRLVYTHLLANGNMSDGAALFVDATHGNLDSTATALDATRLAVAVKKFRQQTAPRAPNDTEFAAEPIDIQPSILLVPPELEFTAEKLVNPNLYVAENQFFKGKYKVEVEPRLSNSSYTGYSATAWYLMAKAEDADNLEVGFLNGSEAPITSSWEDFNSLSVQFRAWLACGVKALDWRGMQKAVGA